MKIDIEKLGWYEEEAPSEEVRELMVSHNLDEETAEQVLETMDEYGVDEDDAVELVKEGL